MIRPARLARLFIALAAAAAVTGIIATQAGAHVPIILVITAPQMDERVGPDTELRVFAQAAIAGVKETSFTVDLDGTPLDPTSGLPAAAPVVVPIRVDETKRIPVRDLSEGEHTLTLTYTPHQDEAPQQGSVQFVVGAARVGGAVGLALVGVAIVAVVLTVRFMARRGRGGPRTAPAPPDE